MANVLCIQKMHGKGLNDREESINVTPSRPNLQLGPILSTSELQQIFKCEAYIFLKYGVSVCSELVVEGRDTQEAFTT